MEQVYSICKRYGLAQDNTVYNALVYAIVFGVEMTEKTIQRWLSEDMPKEKISEILYTYTLSVVRQGKG